MDVNQGNDPATGPSVLREFLQQTRGLVGLISDFDADGLSSAILMEGFLASIGRNFRLRTPERRRNIWDTPPSRWLDLEATSAIVMDLGCRGDKLFSVPTLFIDHHSFQPPQDGDVLYTSYERTEEVATTAGLVWEMVAEEVPHLKWLAALGTYGDLGAKADFSYLTETKKAHTAKALSEAVSLLNAARRVGRPRIELALDVLRSFPDPKLLSRSDDPRVEELRYLREEVRTETERGKQAAPTFSEDTALVVVDSPCQIHPIIAQIWRGRLPKHYVLVANIGYEEGFVHFSGRSRGVMKILKKLRSLPCWTFDAGFGQGHDQAAGGVVSYDLWELILSQLGFPDQVRRSFKKTT